MASKGDKAREGQPTKGYRLGGPAGGERQHVVTVNSGRLRTPEREFYANVFKGHVRNEMFVFVFGQLAPSTDSATVHAEVSLELTAPSLRVVKNVLVDHFRETLNKLGTVALPDYPAGLVANTLTYGATLVRLLVNDFGGVIDFFELAPTIDVTPDPEPILRIKCPPSLLTHFVAKCDEFLGGL